MTSTAERGSESFIIPLTCKGQSGSFISVLHSGCATHFMLLTRLLSSNWWGSSIAASINPKAQVFVGCRGTEDAGTESPWEASEAFNRPAAPASLMKRNWSGSAAVSPSSTRGRCLCLSVDVPHHQYCRVNWEKNRMSRNSSVTKKLK